MQVVTEFDTNEEVYVILGTHIVRDTISKVSVSWYKNSAGEVTYQLNTHTGRFNCYQLFRTKEGAGEKLLENNGLCTIGLKEIK